MTKEVTVTCVCCEATKIDGTIIDVVGAGTGFTVTVAVPDLELSCVDVAVIVAAPVAAGVKTPLALTDPILDGLADQVTALLKAPVPTTVEAQVEV